MTADHPLTTPGAACLCPVPCALCPVPCALCPVPVPCACVCADHAGWRCTRAVDVGCAGRAGHRQLLHGVERAVCMSFLLFLLCHHRSVSPWSARTTGCGVRRSSRGTRAASPGPFRTPLPAAPTWTLGACTHYAHMHARNDAVTRTHTHRSPPTVTKAAAAAACTAAAAAAAAANHHDVIISPLYNKNNTRVHRVLCTCTHAHPVVLRVPEYCFCMLPPPSPLARHRLEVLAHPRRNAGEVEGGVVLDAPRGREGHGPGVVERPHRGGNRHLVPSRLHMQAPYCYCEYFSSWNYSCCCCCCC